MRTLTLILLLLSATLCAQDIQPLQKSATTLAAYQQDASDRHRMAMAELKGPLKKELAEQYEKRYGSIRKMYDSNQVVTDPEATAYLEKLTAIVFAANPELARQRPAVHFSRTYWPNAACYGEGHVFFNIGLFNRLRNESQVAFILCHELAHFYLKHNDTQVREWVEKMNSEEVRDELKSISKSTYQRNKRLEELMKGISFTHRRHGRTHETEADSLALEFMRPTGFDLRETLSALALLDSIDQEKFSGSLQLKEQFNFSDYPFRARWIKVASPTLSEKMQTQTKEKQKLEDSLKTHPDCQLRVEKLRQRAMAAYQSGQRLFLVGENEFRRLSGRFDAECIQFCIDRQELGRALYYTLQLYPQQPGNIWLATTLAKTMNHLYKAQAGHRLGNLIEQPGDSPTPEYEEWLRYLQNVRLSEMAAVHYRYLDKIAARVPENTAFRQELAEATQHNKTSNP